MVLSFSRQIGLGQASGLKIVIEWFMWKSLKCLFDGEVKLDIRLNDTEHSTDALDTHKILHSMTAFLYEKTINLQKWMLSFKDHLAPDMTK